MTRTILLTLLALLAGCRSPAYRSLQSEVDLPHLVPLLETAPTLVETKVTTYGPGARALDLAVWTDPEDESRVVVLIHGVLSDSRAWRYVSGPLSIDNDLMLVDLPGAGESDAPAPFILKRDDPSGYSTPALAYRTAEAIDATLKKRTIPATSVAIVAHSLGTLVTFYMLADESIAPGHRDWMALVDRVALISPVDPAMPYGPPSLEAVATISWLQGEVGELSGVLREQVARGAKRAVSDGNRVPREQVDALYETVSDNHRRIVAQDMLKSIIPNVEIDGVFYPDWTRTESFIQEVRTLGRREDIAWLLIVGERDEVAPASMAYKLAAQLADARLVAIANTKHSPHLERPAIASDIITYFLEHAELQDVGDTVTGVVVERRIQP